MNSIKVACSYKRVYNKSSLRRSWNTKDIYINKDLFYFITCLTRTFFNINSNLILTNICNKRMQKARLCIFLLTFSFHLLFRIFSFRLVWHATFTVNFILCRLESFTKQMMIACQLSILCLFFYEINYSVNTWICCITHVLHQLNEIQFFIVYLARRKFPLSIFNQRFFFVQDTFP